MIGINVQRKALIFLFAVSLIPFAGCSAPPANPGGVGTTVINSNSLITGEISAIRQQSAGYPWEVDVLVLSSENVDNLPNPTTDKVGQVITARTDQDLSAFHTGQKVSANVKYVGDVPKPGIILYIYDIKTM